MDNRREFLRGDRLVTFVVANVKNFRLPFYRGLSSALIQHGVRVQVIYSDPDSVEAQKRDSIDLPAPLGKKVGRWYFLKSRVCIQFVSVPDIIESDLIVVVQANGYLINYPLLLLSVIGIKKVAFWGHGYNHQSRRAGFFDFFKKKISVLPCWWFAYTESTGSYLANAGFSRRKTTVINNSVDTSAFKNELNSVSDEEVVNLRTGLGISPNVPIFLYCGSLYADKRLDFLFEVAAFLRSSGFDFHLIIVGSGQLADYVAERASCVDYVAYVGAKFSREKAVYFKAAKLFLHPGVVGLAILDAFSAGLPFISTINPYHGPEIGYLDDGVNGLLTKPTVSDYAQAVLDLCRDDISLHNMSLSALASSRELSVENMIVRVSQGVLQAMDGRP